MPSISQTPRGLFPLIYICGIMCGFENQWALVFWSQLCPVSWKRWLGEVAMTVLPQEVSNGGHLHEGGSWFFVDLMFWPGVEGEWLNVDWSQQEVCIQRKRRHTFGPEGRLVQPGLSVPLQRPCRPFNLRRHSLTDAFGNSLMENWLKLPQFLI